MVFEDVIYEAKERFSLGVDFSTIDNRMTQAVNLNVNNILNEVDNRVLTPSEGADTIVFHYMRDLESVLWFYRHPSERLTRYIKDKMETPPSPVRRFRFETYRYLSTIFSSLAAHSMLLGATFAYAKKSEPNITRSEIVIELQDVEMGCHLLFTNENKKATWLC